MALSQADAMIERQQHVMQRAMVAWDTTTHHKNSDGRLWQCMEELRAESHNCCGTAKGTYRTGDGDTLPSLRPGSTDAFMLRSHGIRA